jgi:hypothetical protein
VLPVLQILVLLLPILRNVEAPLEFQVLVLVVVDKGRDGVVMAAREHAARGLLFIELLGVDGLLVGVGGVASLVGVLARARK